MMNDIQKMQHKIKLFCNWMDKKFDLITGTTTVNYTIDQNISFISLTNGDYEMEFETLEDFLKCIDLFPLVEDFYCFMGINEIWNYDIFKSYLQPHCETCTCFPELF